MKPYDFKKVFIRYVALLTALLLFIYLSIILIFSWQVNSEIHESSQKELDSLTEALNHQQTIIEGHPYFIIDNEKIITNKTRYNDSILKTRIVTQDVPMMWNTNGHNYQTNKAVLNNGATVYSLMDMSDYVETKNLLLNLLLVLLVLTFIMIIGAAYYIAIKPVRAYEKMLLQHKEFIQNASHELKTPMASISLGIDYINALDGSKLSDVSKHSLLKMKQEVKYAQNLTLRTLKITDEEEAHQIDISRVIDDVISQQEHLHNVHINKHYSEALIYKISGDRLRQMLIILIDNAVKHNDSNVQIDIYAELEEKQLHIEVHDNGKGIPPQYIDRIFERNFRGNSETEGSGIGLSLLKELVTETGGTIEVKSKLNKKTIFILNI